MSLTGGTGVAIQLDGAIFRDGDGGGNMISIDDCDDFEFSVETPKARCKAMAMN